MRDGALARLADDHPAASPRGNRGIDLAGFGRGVAGSQRQVALVGTAFLKLQTQRTVSRGGFGKHNDTAGLAVQPMDREDTISALLERIQKVRGLRLVALRDTRYMWRLVDKKHVRVFIQHPVFPFHTDDLCADSRLNTRRPRA